MSDDGTTQGIWFGEGSQLLHRIKEDADEHGDSFSAWMKAAARERLAIEKTLRKTGVEFDSEFERRNEIRRALQQELGSVQTRHEVQCETCGEVWAFEDEEEAQHFYDDHDLHTGHEADRLVETM